MVLRYVQCTNAVRPATVSGRPESHLDYESSSLPMIARIPDASAQQIVREVPRGWLGAEILRRWPVARHTFRSATTRPPRRGTVCKRWRTQCQIIRGKL